MAVEEQEDINTFSKGVVGFWTQTRLLIEKNWKCRLRTDKKKLFGEIFFPVLYLFLLSFLVRTQPSTEYPAQKEPDSNPMNILLGLRIDTGSTERVISVVPNTTETQELCELMQKIWKRKMMTPPILNFKYYATVKELEDAHNLETGIDLAIVFSEGGNKTSFNYTIMYDPATPLSPPRPSQKTSSLSTCRSNTGTMLESPGTCPVNGYFYSGFLALQYLVDQAILTSSVSSGSAIIPDVYMQNYPKQEFREGMSPFLRAVIPLYSVMPMAQLINSLLVLIVTEKEDRIKDGFRMIGVSDGAYWLSWFSVYSVILGILSFLYTLVMQLTSVIRHTNGILLFLIFFLFGLSVITFAFALTPFFHKPKTAGIVGTLIMQCCGMLFMLQTFLQSADAFMIPLRLISSVAFTTALDEACAHEYSGGIGFSDLLPNRKGARILYSLIFICFDIIFYGLIAVYLDNVIPNEYGARKHPLFCFKWSFWRGRDEKSDGYRRSSLSEEGLDENRDDPNVERVPASMIGKEAIRIKNVHKTYTSMFGATSVQAVKGISLDIYKSQITAILGKQKRRSIITGLVPPTKGTAVVFGMDTSDPCDLDRLRKITGVCLQSDLHFASLTVAEHLELYGKLRGLNGDALSQEISTIMEELKLTEKASTRAANLSGGQKRKLSVGNALVGDPKIILLDEPSAGVDPVSRRHLWSLLKRKKEGRVILLTTHFLDEADFLADRKAIIHDGVLKCHGSSLFLKNRFGVGYHLTIETEGRFQIEHCDTIVEKWAPDALGSKKVIGKEIKYCLPHSDVNVFAELFSDLETLMAAQDSPFKSYGVSMTTLEEVFLKISSDTWEERHNTSPSSATNTNGLNDDRSENENGTIGEECNLIPDQSEMNISLVDSMKALCLVRIRRLIRSPQSMFFMIVMPSLLVAVGLALMRAQELVLKDTLMSFDNPKAIYSEGSQLRVAISGEPPTPEFSNLFKSEGFDTLQYSGIYSDLLKPDLVDPGTMAALNVSDASTSSSTNLRINGTFLHSPPIMLNMLSQYYQKKALENISVSANMNPFSAKRNVFDTASLYAAFLIGPSFTFPAVGMVMELVKDREIRARNHLRVNGVSFGLYFSSVFLVFGLLSVIVIAMQIGLIYIYALPAFMNPYAMIVSVFLLLFFIPSCLLFSTAVSYFFDRLESAQSIFSPISSWAGTLFGIAIIIMDGLSSVSGSKHVLISHSIFSALNVFYIPFGVFYWINKKYILCSILDNCDELGFKDYLSPEIVIMAVCLIVQIPIFVVLVLVADIVKNEGSIGSAIKSIFTRNASRIHASNSESNGDGESLTGESIDDEDVNNEKIRVSNILNGTDPIDNSVVVVQNLKKTYRPNVSLKDRCKKREAEGQQALKGINFVVEKGEVFGLLGHNGAGKTTAMRIIIAEEGADTGRVRLCGTDIHSSYSDAFLTLGYCAQHDPLWENITLREHLELYAVVRGIPKERRTRLINHFLTGLQIGEHADKKAAELSGGTKRKLSYGISMLGAPSIVLLDEPSTGMDPQSKRFLWNTVLGTFKDSRGAILVTHSLEEAEILSTRIAILAKGSIICIGSPQHLKSKYGTGYTLEIKLKSSPQDYANNSSEDRFAFVKDHFPDSKVNEVFDDKGVFALTTASVQSISRTFSLLEQLKKQYDIEEYSFSQTTLEQIFLLFAKENEDNDNE
ncbi:ATP-binding cassette sub-family A member 5 [Orchesella cincta]|uniref:ATP-binding cassette sub-family A member 5 n=1 Tax=Orchesella cincta TaxID=48709 RepID=A0A1D2ML69_ORCCI|nr:ATP-binding cassette sub-family A member 5 [Orchesella cincta]